MPIASPLPRRRTVTALLLLTFATGLVDAISVLVLGRVFVANMTGNAIFLGFLFVPDTGFDLTAAIDAVAGFLAGAIIGGRLARRFGERAPRRWLCAALGFEAALLLVLAGAAGLGVLRYDDASKLILIAGLALAFGVQNSTARQFGIQELYTTVLTSTIVGIGVDSRLAGGSGDRQGLRYGVVLVMLSGAVVGATLTHLFIAPVIALAAVVVLAALLLFRFG
ncbi:YoaK family protein [[Mycobacterium] kokjensenii]|uniref:YoaK family protein n=1 Tax=[Mycobacterium] kokjensenii TaxID=3064287 RepID=A0ABM9L654_9MYCO|nr:YoaK family protein [Mycolicibacter sp. MU0083]CAJ1493037.1 YoaK family protein [Mycolicibacter sp. MU0083]